MLSEPRTRCEAEARERAQFLLGALSLVIWFVVAFGLAALFGVTDEDDARHIMTAGGIAFLCAALPWLAYGPLVRRLQRRS